MYIFLPVLHIAPSIYVLMYAMLYFRWRVYERILFFQVLFRLLHLIELV